jgi:DNA-binding IscR family transcriptional regulator
LSEIIRLVDGPLAPFGDADQLRGLITSDPEHRALYKVFLDVRDAAAKILEGTTVADLVQGSPARRKSATAKKQTTKARLAAMVHPLDKPML